MIKMSWNCKTCFWLTLKDEQEPCNSCKYGKASKKKPYSPKQDINNQIYKAKVDKERAEKYEANRLKIMKELK